MTSLAFSMSGEPRGKGRPRVDTRGAFPRIHTDSKTIKYESSITKIAREKMAGRPPLVGPLSVSIQFRMPIPKSATKAARTAMAAGEIAPTGKPDIDNMVKAILDAIGEDFALKKKLPKSERDQARVVFCNDSQVTRLFVTKIYAEHPGVDVRVEAFAPQTGEGA